VYLSVVAQSFEHLTGFVYQMGFISMGSLTVLRLLCVLDYFLVLYLHACCIIVTRWGEPG